MVVAGLTMMSCDKQDENLTVNSSSKDANARVAAVGAWVRQFTEDFSNATFSQWTKTNRKDYNSAFCQYDPTVPKVATVDGVSSLVLTATKTGYQAFKSGHIKSNYSFKPTINTEYKVTSMIKLIATENGAYKSFSSTYGAWPSIWMTDESVWPTHGEVDIMEGYSFGGTTNFTSNTFYGTQIGDDVVENAYLTKYPASFNSGGWHKYECYWKNLNNVVTISTYIDGVLIKTFTQTGIMNLNNFGPHNIILNLNVASDAKYNIFDINKINLLTNTQMWVDYVTIDKRTI